MKNNKLYIYKINKYKLFFEYKFIIGKLFFARIT